jgi:hypothetical protein
MIKSNGGVFGRNPTFQDVTVDGNLTVNGDIALGDDIVVTDTLTVNGITTLASTTESTNKDTGALVVEGGVGIEKRLNVGGQFGALATTASSSTTTGAAVISGGLGVAGAINAGAASSITGNLTLSSGNLIVSSGNGIDFSATANSSGTMTSELLNDYEEGTWSPVYASESGTLGTVTYDAATAGTYTKVGRQVTVVGYILTDAFAAGTGSGGMRITGLPFTVASLTGGCVIGFATSFSGAANCTPRTGQLAAGNTVIQLQKISGDGTGRTVNLDVADMAGNFADHNIIRFTATYFT